MKSKMNPKITRFFLMYFCFSCRYVNNEVRNEPEIRMAVAICQRKNGLIQFLRLSYCKTMKISKTTAKQKSIKQQKKNFFLSQLASDYSIRAELAGSLLMTSYCVIALPQTDCLAGPSLPLNQINPSSAVLFRVEVYITCSRTNDFSVYESYNKPAAASIASPFSEFLIYTEQ